MTSTNDKPFEFEKNLNKLQEIVEKMENEPLDLDQALQNFENGVKLTRQCEKALQAAELRISTIKQQDNA